jgi:TolB-like protein/Tfp pilus assembly protein PilF
VTDNSPEQSDRKLSWFSQLIHKRVFQTLAIYIAIAWGGTEILLAMQDTLGFPEWISRLAMAMFIAGMPVAAFLAWAHDLKSRATRILLRTVAIVILVTGAVLVFQQSRSPGPPEASLAVLPFLDMSPNAGQSWLVNALAEDLRNAMAQAGDLLVIAATSSDVFRGRADELDVIREKLNVRHVLSGSVRQDKDILRISANLVDTVTGRHVWSDRYDMPVENLFDIEDRIVDRIAGSLSVTLAPAVGEGGTRSLAAYEAYQRAHETESWDTSVLNYEEALRIDPGFAWPLIEMAANYVFRSENGFITAQEAWDEAVPLLERAQNINAGISEIYTVYGMLNTFLQNYQQAQSHYEHALELNPNNAFTYGVYGLLMRWGLGQFEEAVTLHERNVQVDPLDYTANLQLGTSYWMVERYEDAKLQYEKAIRICPGCGVAYQSYSGMLGEGLGRVDESLGMRYTMFAKLHGDPTPRQLAGAAGGHAALGDMESADKYVAAIELLAPDSPFLIEWRVQTYLEEAEFGKVRAIAESALQTNARDAEALGILAVIDLKQGDAQEAVDRYQAIAPGIFDNPPTLEGVSEYLGKALFRALIAADHLEQLQRIIEEMERSFPDQIGVSELLLAGRLDQAIAKVREEHPGGLINPGHCKGLQDELPWLPASVESGDPKLQALIEDACAERERQLANVRRKLESSEYRLPEIVAKSKPAENR